MLTKIISLSLLTIYAAFTIGCTSNAEKVETLLNSDPSGEKWDLVKSPTEKKGFAVYKGPDGKFYALEVGKYKEGMTVEQFKAAGTSYSGLVKSTRLEEVWETPLGNFPLTCGKQMNCREVVSCSFPPCGITYDAFVDYYKDLASGIEFEQGDTGAKDLETLAATLEEENLSTIKSGLVSQYGLSETRASELASMANSMKNIADSQGRALTDRDLESLQVKAMGASLSEYKKAKASGDTKAIEKMTAKAASMNKISPEQAKRLMKQLGL